jgi:putative membrane protein
MWGYYGHMYVARSPGFSWTSLFPFFIILGVILLIWAIAAHRRDRDDMSDNEDAQREEETALEILKKRYARGEITKRQYLEMKKDIE